MRWGHGGSGRGLGCHDLRAGSIESPPLVVKNRGLMLPLSPSSGHQAQSVNALPQAGVEHLLKVCHDPQCSRACWTYFPWPQTRCIDPGSILAEQRTMPDEATKVGMRNTDAHICAPSLFSSQHVYIYLTSTGNFPSLEIN